ncbi:MAG: AraC family transcriptional regulator [Lachnospiraceae bacterium]|nr:AraC family transcriptional regulator [Lachnospiraceae bacterium]
MKQSNHSIGFSFSSDLPLLALVGLGHHYIDSHDYSWNSRNRNQSLCLIQYCIEGEGALEVDGILYSILPGDAFIIDIPGENHYYLPPHSSYWEILYLEFSKECLPLIRKIYRVKGPVVHLTKESGLADQMMSIYERAVRNEIKTFFENTKAAYNLWMDFTVYALTCSEDEISKIDHVKAYIDQNYYMEDLNLDLVAEHAGISKYYMCKEFHKKYGITPGKYLKELRISQACRLLTTNSDHTIQDIARMVGYSNNNYFGKVFKASKGITPDKFRKQSTQYDFVRVVYETPKRI